jgi:hypothetical protein
MVVSCLAGEAWIVGRTVLHYVTFFHTCCRHEYNWGSQTGCLSFILISGRTWSDQTEIDLDPIAPSNGNIPDMGQPYIAIHASLRTKDNNLSFDTTSSEVSTNALRIYATEIHPAVYSFLGDPEMLSMAVSLQNILDASDTAKQLPCYSALLRDQVLYGDMTGIGHMGWKAGREKPNGAC